MPLLGLAVAALVGSLSTLFYANDHGGFRAELSTQHHVVTGEMLYGIVALLLFAALALACAAIIRAMEVTAMFVAGLAAFASASIGGVTLDAIVTYATTHGLLM